MQRVTLIGDTVFDNERYQARSYTVTAHLRKFLGEGWVLTNLAAQDVGVADVTGQLSEVPPDTSRLFVSAGGVDVNRLHEMAFSKPRAGAEFARTQYTLREEFKAAYGAMLAAVLELDIPTVLVNVHAPQIEYRVMDRIISALTPLHNAAILDLALEHGLPVIHLHAVCPERSDFSHSSYLSGDGGLKLAAAIRTVAANHDFEDKRCVVYGADAARLPRWAT